MAYYIHDKPQRKVNFSKKEIQDLLIAMGIITVAFAIALSIPLGGWFLNIDWGAFPQALLISLLAVGTGFFLHELGHKFVATKYGAWAEFRAWIQGLMMAMFLALTFGVVFAAPGAVYIAGNINKEQNGKISIVGPLVNLTFAGICFPLIFITTGLLLKEILFYIYYINAFLAVFNLLPFRPMDGAKVLDWNIIIYGLILGASIGLLVPAFVPGLI